MRISRDILKKLAATVCINMGNANFRGYLFRNYWAVWEPKLAKMGINRSETICQVQ
ncbi:hypothetical protein T10_4600 [Trichinella papuae]|uniref:Uncharacterized protein n=1 Tax=Trichinella papuae TaxID=268474 RepID=A0A0V1LZI1_9BILA|nr:hypothetical protein T10_4600 [Trichinella papuae]